MHTYFSEGRWGGAWIVALAGLAGLGCTATGPSCNSLDQVPAVVATVVDSSGNPVCDVSVQIQGTNVDARVDLSAENCSASGGDWGGDYVVVVSRAGTELARQDVQVASDECVAVQEQVVISLP